MKIQKAKTATAGQVDNARRSFFSASAILLQLLY